MLCQRLQSSTARAISSQKKHMFSFSKGGQRSKSFFFTPSPPTTRSRGLVDPDAASSFFFCSQPALTRRRSLPEAKPAPISSPPSIPSSSHSHSHSLPLNSPFFNLCSAQQRHQVSACPTSSLHPPFLTRRPSWPKQPKFTSGWSLRPPQGPCLGFCS